MPPKSTPIPAEGVVQKGPVKVNSRAPRQNLVWLAGCVRYSEPCALSLGFGVAKCTQEILADSHNNANFKMGEQGHPKISESMLEQLCIQYLINVGKF